LLILTAIVTQSWASNNSLPAQNAPFSNTTSTNSFQPKKNSGSCRPIFKIKTDSVHEKFHLPFAERENLEGCKKF